jgi:5S rRNA maturation endonuclease (ribonuclease M5)
MKTMKKRYRSYNQQQLKVLSDRLCDEIESLLSYFGVEYKVFSKMITMSCPIHGGDNNSALNLYPEGDRYRGNWKCRTHQCEQLFKSSILGFIRGVISHQEHNWTSDGDPTCSFEEALEFAQKFINQNLDDIKIDKKHQEKNNFINTVNYINTSTSSINVNKVSRTQVQKALNIPSKYFINRGYTENILKKYDVGDCIINGKEMYKRAVVPVYDIDNKHMVGCTGRSIHEKCSLCKSYHDDQTTCPNDNELWLSSKWRHSKDFKTQEYLYNFWFAKEYISKQQYVILVESPGNVWRLEESDIHNSVAIFGSSLSDKQKMLLDISGALSVILLMDNDEAGHKAREAIIKKCSKTYNIFTINISKNDVGSMSTEEIKSEIIPQIESFNL